jgi:uncharacterized membrane protein YhaH (DUF805 family)
MSTNPYAAPRAAVSDIETQEYQEIRLWSAAGRIGRLRYLAYACGAALVVGVVSGLLTVLIDPGTAMVVTMVLYVPLIVFSIICGIKRSHDMNWSGWTILLAIIPLVGFIWLFKPGTPGSNDYGAPPPPNTTGVKILGLLLPAIFIIGIVAAIAIPAYVQYTQRAAGM